VLLFKFGNCITTNFYSKAKALIICCLKNRTQYEKNNPYFGITHFRNERQCEINRGQWIVGGRANFSYTKSSDDNGTIHNATKTTSLELLPGAGYFFMNKFCGGLRTGVSYSGQESNFSALTGTFHSTSFSKSKMTSYMISPFLRYYFLPASSKVNFLGDISYSYNHNKQNINYNQSQYDDNPNPPQQPVSYANSFSFKSHSSSYTISAGPAFFLNSKVSLELTIGYKLSKYSGTSDNSFIAGAGFQVHL